MSSITRRCIKTVLFYDERLKARKFPERPRGLPPVDQDGQSPSRRAVILPFITMSPIGVPETVLFISIEYSSSPNLPVISILVTPPFPALQVIAISIVSPERSNLS